MGVLPPPCGYSPHRSVILPEGLSCRGGKEPPDSAWGNYGLLKDRLDVSESCIRAACRERVLASAFAHLENTVPCGTGLPEKPCGQALPVRSIPERVLPGSRKLSSMDRAPLTGSKSMTNSRLLFV